MRKFLLASAATLGTAGFVGGAYAQAPAPAPLAPTQGQYIGAPAGSPPAGANNNNNYQAAQLPGPVANPTPGTIVIHFNGRIESGMSASFTSLDTNPGATAGAPPTKISPVLTNAFMRMFFGGDAMATNGLRYGGAIELRQNFGTQGSSTASSGGSTYTTTQTVYVRRAFSYVAGDQWGIVRVGVADGPIGIFDNGVTTFQYLPTGVFNGGDTEAAVPGGAAVTSPFLSQSGNEYGYAKVVYLSPQIAGFDFGLSYAPNTTNGFGITNCSTVGSGCPNLSSSPLPADASRLTNITEVGARYQGLLGGVGILAYAAWMHSGTVDYTGGVAAARGTGATGTPAGGTFSGKFNGVNLGSGGIALTFAGVTVGGNVVGGQVNGLGAAQPQGGVNELGWLAGAKYVTGPLTIGAVYENVNSQGAPQLVNISQRHEWAMEAGLGYAIAPGLTAYAEYIYQQRHQGSFNFATNATSGATAGANNNTRAQEFLVGTNVTW